MADSTTTASPPRNPISPKPRKHLPFRTKHHQPTIPKHLLPLLSHCHSCNQTLTLPNLQTLDSQWRLLLLCQPCLSSIHSHSLCSYCFSPINSLPSLTCRRCRSRVHVSCIPKQRGGYVSLCDFNPDTFECIDCCPISKGSSNGVWVEDLVREAKIKTELAGRLREKAAEKVALAEKAKKKAREAVERFVKCGPAVRDEELARKLHRVMNGSKRRLRRGEVRRVELCEEDKGFFDDEVVNSSSGLKRKVELCGEDKESVGSSVAVGCFEERKVKCGVGDEGMKKCGKKEKCGLVDRYMKKYSKRKPEVKGALDKESRIVSCWQMSCSTGFLDAPLSSLSGCQS